jgi:GT2 family glycosyltransferase
MVSVVIVNYHCAELTAVAVQSVLEDCDEAQVVVVDNSADEAEYERLKALLPCAVECIATPENIGFGRACNLGYSRCVHEYIFLLNPDTRLVKGCVQKLKEALEADVGLGAVSPQSFWDEELRFFLPPGQLQTPSWELVNALGYRWAWFGNRFSKWFRRYAISTITAQTAIKQSMVSGGHLMVARATIERLGGLFDEAFFLYYEDTDLNLRMTALGLGLALIPDAKVVHFWRSDASKGKFCPESRRIYMEKNFPNSLVLKLKGFVEKMALASLGAYTEMGILSQPPKFEVGGGQEDWVLEISQNRLFVPSVIGMGNGEECSLPQEIWDLLGNGEYWARVGSDEKTVGVFRWTKA